MDNTGGTTPGGGSGSASGQDPREELRAQLEVMGKAAGELLEQLVKVPGTLAQIPLQVLPEDTATHARNAATEGFAAVRSLLDVMTKGVDQVLRDQRERMANMGSTRTGVGGTSAPSEEPAADTQTRALDSGSAESSSPAAEQQTSYLGGHGTGAGPEGTGGNGTGNTIRLDDES
jgi:hypothetical protein